MWCHKFQMKIVKHCSFFLFSVFPSRSYLRSFNGFLIHSVLDFFVLFFYCYCCYFRRHFFFCGIGSRLNVYVTFFRQMDKRRIVCVYICVKDADKAYILVHVWVWENICSVVTHSLTCTHTHTQTLAEMKKKSEGKMINHEWSMKEMKVLHWIKIHECTCCSVRWYSKQWYNDKITLGNEDKMLLLWCICVYAMRVWV